MALTEPNRRRGYRARRCHTCPAGPLHHCCGSTKALVSCHRAELLEDLPGAQSTQDRGLCRRHGGPRHARLAPGRRDYAQSRTGAYRPRRQRAVASGDRRPSRAFSGNPGDARHQRLVLSRDCRGDRDAGRHGDVAAGARPRHARQDPEGRIMTDISDRLLRLNAALDGELDAMGSLAFERELRDDPAFAAEYRRLTTLRDAVRRHAPREAAPQALADRIAALTASAPAAPSPQAIATPTATVVPFRRRTWLDSRALAMAASFAVLGFAVGAGLTSLRAPASSGDVAQHLVSDFARAEIAGQPFDVASSDRHTVKPWLANRTTVSGTIVDLAPEGFPLVGGRVTIVDRVPMPTLVYRHNEHVVAVTELPVDAKLARGTGGIETIDGYHVARWADANLAYVAVSDMDEKALGEFVEAFRRGGGLATEPSRP